MHEPFTNPKTGKREPHPFPVTLKFISEALGQLRAMTIDDDSTKDLASSTLWRGIKDRRFPKDFKRNGHTEMAPMSTTADVKVAMGYSEGARHERLVIKLQTRGFTNYGVSIRFLSVFPGEDERLYPPLTHLKPTGKTGKYVGDDGIKCQFIECKPEWPTGR